MFPISSTNVMIGPRLVVFWSDIHLVNSYSHNVQRVETLHINTKVQTGWDKEDEE